MAEARHACQCCGHRTLTAAPNGWTLAICEVCGWEDSWEHGEALRMLPDLGFEAAQRAFVATGAVHPDVAELVRPARPEEAPEPAFGYLWEHRERAASAVRAAFAGVRRDGGMSLYDAELADMYGHVGAYLKPAMREVPERWEDLEPHHFTDFPQDGAPVFLDPKGFRFYLPALVCFHLGDPALIDVGSWLFCLHYDSAPRREVRAVLTRAQRDAVIAWLRVLLMPPRWLHAAKDLERAIAALSEGDDAGAGEVTGGS
ncbi:MAG: hypothetical protein KC635_19470 [Myxococcales bacterium]|nr:hypothetical protein [Myxococcales bacterium]